MTYQEIANSVVFSENKYGSNTACIALEEELIFVEAGLNTLKAKDFRIAMENKFKRKASTLILTHGHIDHFYAMDAFADIQVIAAKEAKPKIERFVKAEFTDELIANFERVFPTFTEAAKDAKLFMPEKWINGKMSIGKNDEIQIQVTGGHSNCSSSIHFAPEKILAAGDLLQVNGYPYFGEPDTDIGKWTNAIKTWEQMELDAIIPGHGSLVKKQFLTKVRVFFEEMVEVLIELKKENISEEEIANHIKLPVGYWPKDAIRTPSYVYSIVSLYKKL
ncbi:MAG TPA: MBL fold metallo-hydrolase [candidate division Zixibacteria bacterium]|nr:MBL fold metallo-hydrolase [candidate division Zixibacteria bacterium]